MTIDLLNLPDITNKKFYPFYKNKNRYCVYVGGAGSGKSFSAIQKVLFRILTERNHKFLVIRKVGATLKDSVVALFLSSLKQWGLEGFYEFNKTDFTIKFPALNSEILFKGLDDSEKIKSIAGITSIFIEEATELTIGDFKQLDKRLRGITPFYKQIILALNPVNSRHWIKKHFIDTIQEDCVVLNSTYKDNRFLDEAYIKVLEGETDAILRKIYTKGEWGEVKGVIFNNWQVKNLDEFLPLYKDKLLHGLDFGVNDPIAFGVQCLDMNKKELYIFDEVYKRGVETNSEIAELIAPLCQKRIVVCDNAEPKSINELKQLGIRATECKKSAGSVMSGIKFLSQFKIFIDPKCVNAIQEFGSFRWRVDKNGESLDEPLDRDNHFIDQLRYSVEHLSAGRNMKASVVSAAQLGF